MIDHARTWLRHQQSRWLRPDADRWVRPMPGASFRRAGISPRPSPRWRTNTIRTSRAYLPAAPMAASGPTAAAARPSRWGDLGFGDLGFGNLAGLEDFGALFQITPSQTDLDGVQLAGDLPEGIGHNQGASLDEPPEIPQQRPETRSERMDFVRSAVAWIREARRYTPAVSMFLEALDQAEDLKALTDTIKTANDPPATLEELQARAQLPSEAGYEDHHIVGQFAQNGLQFGDDLIDSPENKVRLPTLKHLDINGWYSRPNERFGGLSPRDYLRGKSWDEQMSVGLEVLRKQGALK